MRSRFSTARPICSALVALGLCVVSWGAQANTVGVCSDAASEPGLDGDTVREALRLEARKSELIVTIPTNVDCNALPDDALHIAIRGVDVFVHLQGRSQALSLGDVDPWSRSGEVARVAVAMLWEKRGAPLTPVIEGHISTVEPQPKAKASGWSMEGHLGGELTHQPRSGVQVLGVRVGLRVPSGLDAVRIGVVGFWSPAQSLAGPLEVDASLWGGGLGLSAHLTGELLGAEVGLAGAAGWARSGVEVLAPSRLGRSTSAHDAGWGELELSAAWWLGPVSLQAGAYLRQYTAGRDRTWAGEPLYLAPSGAGGVRLSLGWRLL